MVAKKALTTGVEKKFVARQETWDAMESLADITGVEGRGEGRLGPFLMEESRIFEWVIYHQMKGRVVVAFDPEHVEFLKKTKKVSGECEQLSNFIKKGKARLVREYFKKSAASK